MTSLSDDLNAMITRRIKVAGLSKNKRVNAMCYIVGDLVEVLVRLCDGEIIETVEEFNNWPVAEANEKFVREILAEKLAKPN